MIPIVGIVGGIGSGKSLVADELVKHGGYVIAGDVLGHEALRQASIKEHVVLHWGTDLLNERGDIDRRRLGRKVFADTKELRALEEFVFPWISRRIHEEIVKVRSNPAVRFIVLDAAVMMEAGWDKNCDRVIFVDAPRDARVQRLRSRRGWSMQEIAARENAQWPLDEKRKRADAIIDNSKEPAHAADQIEKLLQEWSILSVPAKR